jgi:DDE superfamily endonuclease
VVFSDESRFCLFHSDGRAKVWRRVGERYHPDCMTPTVKFGGGSVMVWGCFSWWGVGPLVVIKDTLNQNRYVNLMSQHLVPYLKEVNEKCHGVIFQQDNASCHAAPYATWWRRTHSIRCLPWPSQSPDLNPIEHLWDHLDRQVRKRNPLPTSPAAMAEALQDEWQNIPLFVVRKLMLSMPKRLEAVRKAGGLSTRY